MKATTSKKQMIQKRVQTLKRSLSRLTGETIEITIRGEQSFTFSFIGENKKAVSALESFFKHTARSIAADYDAECDQTVIYIDV